VVPSTKDRGDAVPRYKKTRLGGTEERRRGPAALATATDSASPADPLSFARSLDTTATTAEVRVTHRRPKRRYKKRIRMPSKLDPYPATIENWFAVEPQLTALTIVRRLAAIDPSMTSSIRPFSACFDPSGRRWWGQSSHPCQRNQ
jgi:hypothetical protein